MSKRIKNSPLWLYMILYSLRENSPSSRISKIGDLKAKITHNLIDTNSAKMGSESTTCIRFSKIFAGRSRPPPPYCEKIPLPSSTAKAKILPHRSFEDKNYIQFFGIKSTRTLQKNGLRMHHLHFLSNIDCLVPQVRTLSFLKS